MDQQETTQDRVDHLVQLFQGIYPIAYFRFDTDGNLMDRIDPLEYDFTALLQSELKDTIEAHLRSNNWRDPFVVQDVFELTWSGFAEYDGKELAAVHILGPVFFDNISLSNVQVTLSKNHMPLKVKHRLIETMRKLPVIYSVSFTDYTRMLYQCVNGSTVDINHISLLSPASIASVTSNEQFRTVSQHGTWDIEQRMCRMVEEGNLNYLEEMNSFLNVGHTGIMSTTSSVRQQLYLCISQIVLVSRAAVRGGMSPETSYSLSDMYIQMLDRATSVAEINEISQRLMEDYIHRVHAIHENSQVSDPIRQCADYIGMHYAEGLNTDDLAAMVGYSGNYLSKKFKEEMHISLVQYITQTRIRHSIEMLRDHKIPIADISDSLGFTSQSYFGVQFRKYTGTTPGEFRKTGHIPRKDLLEGTI